MLHSDNNNDDDDYDDDDNINNINNNIPVIKSNTSKNECLLSRTSDTNWLSKPTLSNLT